MAVTPIDPHTLDALEAEYDAREISGLSDSDPVDTWPQSASGGLNDATASGSDRPEYVAVDQNSLPGVRFDGSERLTIASITSSAARTVIAVGRVEASGGNQSCFSWWNSSGSRGSTIVRSSSQSHRFGFWTSTVSWVMSSPTYVIPLDTTHVMTWAWDDSDDRSLLINTDRADRRWPSNPDTIPAGTTGVLGGNQPSDPTFQGVFNHILVFDEKLTRSEVEGIQAWLADIWDPPGADRWTYTPSGTPAQDVRDFGDDTLSAQPADTTERWNASGDWLVVEHAGADNGRAVRCTTATSVKALSFDDLDGETDLEILARALGGSSDSARPGVVLRSGTSLDGSSNRPDDSLIARSRVGFQVGPWNLRERETDSTITFDWDIGPSHDTSDWYFIRFRVENDLAYFSGWGDADPEPADWLVVFEIAAETGFHGIDAFQSSDSYFDYVAWGTNGATATVVEEIDATLDADLQPLGSTLSGEAVNPVTGTLDASLQALSSSLSGAFDAESEGTLDADLQALGSTLEGEAPIVAEGTLAASLEPLGSTLSGESAGPNEGTLDATLQALGSTLSGEFITGTTGSLDVTLQALTSSFSGTVEEGPPDPDTSTALVLHLENPGDVEILVAPEGHTLSDTPRIPAERGYDSGLALASGVVDRGVEIQTAWMDRDTDGEEHRDALRHLGTLWATGYMVDGQAKVAIRRVRQEQNRATKYVRFSFQLMVASTAAAAES